MPPTSRTRPPAPRRTSSRVPRRRTSVPTSTDSADKKYINKTSYVRRPTAAPTPPSPPPAPRAAAPRAPRAAAPRAAAPKAAAPKAAAPKAEAVSNTLDLDSIREALTAISAQFDLSEADLTAEGDAARRAFKFLSEQFKQGEADDIRHQQGAAAGRGLLRSGIALRETSETAEAYAKQRTQAVSERDARLRHIASRMAALAAEEKARRAAEARRLATEQVGSKEAIARALKLA